MKVTWDGARPPKLPPKRPGDRFRLGWRLLLSITSLVALFPIFVLARTLDVVAGRISGRPVSRSGPEIVRLWAKIALKILGLRLRIIGAPMHGSGAYVANHASWIDIIALQAAVAPYLVSKADVRAWPVIGAIGAAIGTLFIERDPLAARKQQDALRLRMIQGDRLALFPEGTSSDGFGVLPFKSSLFEVFFAPELRGKAAVQPVAIRYRPRRPLPDSFYGWWGDADFSGHLLDVLALSSGGVVTLSFLEPLTLDGMSDRKHAARTAEEMVRREFERLSASAP